MKKNIYYLSYLPLLIIVIYSISFGQYFQAKIMVYLSHSGMMEQLLAVFSQLQIRIGIFVILVFLFFMVFATLKLIANTLLQTSLLFFSKDSSGRGIFISKIGSIVYVISAILSLIFSQSIWALVLLFVIASFVYFLFYMYQIRDEMSWVGMFGIVLFQFTFWLMIIGFVAFASLNIIHNFVTKIVSQIIK